jgi:drug/metabolite transporter (DMT)-like permease
MNTKLLILYAGFFATGLPLFLYYYSLKKLGAAKVTVFYYLSPISAIILSAIILQEPITILLLVGTFLAFIGIGLAQKEKL